MNRRQSISLLLRIVLSGTVLAGVLGLDPEDALGCAVPVFRYALERWPADAYHATVFHRGPMDAAGRKTLAALEDGANRGLGNVEVVTVDLAGEVPAEQQALWKAQHEATAPWMEVRFPSGEGVLWAGPFDEASVRSLTDSPKRRELARRLIAGDSAVWLLLESGDKATDDAAERVLRSELANAARVLAPEVLERLRDAGLADDEAKSARVAFSVLRVSRDDPAERLLVDMLIQSEADLDHYAGEPMAFPAFGRGRILGAMVGPGIRVDNILEACNFIVGDCSCEIKAGNPGTDLLLSADWAAAVDVDLVSLSETGPLTSLDATNVVSAPGREPVAAAVDFGQPPSVPRASPIRRALWTAGTIAVLAVLYGAAAMVRNRGRKETDR